MSLNGAQLPLPELAKLCQRAENLFVGARVGIMDQFVSCKGKAGHALLLDCRSLEFKLIPIPDNLRLVICNTMVKHEHASGAYNRRREECAEGVRILTQWFPSIRALRDVSIEQLEQHVAGIPQTIYKRCLHVVSENQRVLAGAKYLTDGNVEPVRRPDAPIALQSSRSVRSQLPGTRRHGRNRRVSGGVLWRAHDGGWVRRMHGEPGEGRGRTKIRRRNLGTISIGHRNQARCVCMFSRRWSHCRLVVSGVSRTGVFFTSFVLSWLPRTPHRARRIRRFNPQMARVDFRITR